MTHLTSPPGERPFAFPACDESFSDERNLIIHSQAEEQEYKCILCGKCFNQQPSLTRHQKNHAGERAYICPECGKSFSLKHNLIIHQRTLQDLKACSSGLAKIQPWDHCRPQSSTGWPWSSIRCWPGCSEQVEARHAGIRVLRKPLLHIKG
uniref:C2H2-type domain-containing protein n=1 Tax=Terrapene triunguis TaxID=2587831 RepID=A0A674K548_9SAUR